MRKGRILKVFLCAGIVLSVGVLGNYVTSLTTTMCKETELAGMSYTLQQYVDAHSAGAASDPEAIVAFPDDPATAGDPAADPNAAPAPDGSVGGETPAPTEAPEATPAPKSEYDNVGISVAADYVNVRKKPNTDSKVVGKLYRGSAAKIKDTVGDWVKIRSGHVEGYIKSEYLAIGFSAEKLVDKFGTKIATVNTETLKVREAKNTDCAVLTLVSGEESFEVLREDKEWVKIMVDGDTKGFVSKEYVDITVKFKKAVSIEEEREEARKKAAAAAAAAQADAPQQPAQSNSSSQNSSNSNSGSSSSNKGSSSSNKGSSGKSDSSGKSGSSGNSGGNSGNSGSSGGESSSNSGGSVVGSGDGSSIASYALQFVGNPYVYGGSSLTNGTDCSGFSQAVFRKFGINLPRTSGEQAGVGKKISVSSARAGDLIFYARNGHINHVAICIGGGRVVHASNPTTGITTSNIGYRTPYCARRIVG